MLIVHGTKIHTALGDYAFIRMINTLIARYRCVCTYVLGDVSIHG